MLRLDAAAAPAPAPASSSSKPGQPDPAAAAAVRGWLAGHGITGHDAGFSVAASAPLAEFERLFGPRTHPQVPAPLARWVSAVVLPPAPTMF